VHWILSEVEDIYINCLKLNLTYLRTLFLTDLFFHTCMCRLVFLSWLQFVQCLCILFLFYLTVLIACMICFYYVCDCHTYLPVENNPLKKFFISAMRVLIWAKLSDFVCEYSDNVSCKFYWNHLSPIWFNRYSSLNFNPYIAIGGVFYPPPDALFILLLWNRL